jgi:hypothetical protein
MIVLSIIRDSVLLLLRARKVLKNFCCNRANLLCEESCYHFRSSILAPEVVAHEHVIGVEL